MFRRFALALAWALAASAAQAHPHVFIDAEAGFVFDAEGRLASVEIVWRYDAFSSLFLLEDMGLDPDGDGALTEAERAALAADQTDWPETFAGDSYLRIGGEAAALSPARDGSAALEDGRVVVRFRRDLAEPAPAQGLQARLELYDPSYFFAYALTGEPALRDAPAACAAQARRFDPDAAASELLASLATLGREETPEDPNVGAAFADAALLRCD
ncbi:MAG: DUF1007 family protein [Rubrimonas sp.]|uniref:DUF1007 family protein n=1 Tax=Rubrimonas sp. TaxID=2036015 RepID=UPI002FDEABA2